MTRVRLRQTVNAIMELIERRNAMSWQHATQPKLLERPHESGLRPSIAA